MEASLAPLLDGMRAELTRRVAAHREDQDRQAAVAWLNQAARLAARAPRGLVEVTAGALGRALGDPTMGRRFLDKVAYYQVLGDLERDAGQDLAGDVRLATVAPEILEDLHSDRRRLAKEQGLGRQAEAAKARASFSRELAQAFTDATRGVAGPAFTQAQFEALYGAAEGQRRWLVYQATQAKVPAYALVRGRSAAELAAAKADYVGDRARLAAVEAEDAAERQRDPAGYGLAWAPGARLAYERSLDPAERAAILWEAQGQVGIPETERSPWTGERAVALAEGWLAITEGPGAAKARVELLREELLSLPPAQRAAGQSTLERLLAGDGRIGAVLAALEDSRLGEAWAAAGAEWEPAVAHPGVVQLAVSGEGVSDADAVGAGDVGAARTANGEVPTWPIFASPPDLGRSQGLPDASGGNWRESAYGPGRKNELEGLLASILALPENPRSKERVLQNIRQVFADDPTTAARLTDWVHTIASASGFAPVGLLESARAAVLQMYRRVQEGAPYDATWAAARSDLAALEESTGYRFRPAGPGTVAVLDSAGRRLLDLPLKGVGDLRRVDLKRYLGDIESVLTGDLSTTEMEELAKRYDEVDVHGPIGELPDDTLIEGDHRAAQAVRDAHAAALIDPDARAEIGRDLLQVLIELDGSLDLEQLAIETALEFLPGKGIYDLAVDALALAEAIEAGDWESVAILGGVALLDAVGTVPVFGTLAKRGLRRLAGGLGIVKTAGEEAAERLGRRARTGSKEAEGLESETRDNNALAKDGEAVEEASSQDDFVRRAEEQIARAQRPNRQALSSREIVGEERWSGLDVVQQRELEGDVRRIVGEQGEGIVLPAVRNKLLRDGYDPLPVQLEAIYRGQRFFPDQIGIKTGAQVTPSGMADRDVMKIKTGDGAWVSYRIVDVRVLDAKMAKGPLTPAQRKVNSALRDAGHEGIIKASPRFADLDFAATANALNQSRTFKAHGIVVSAADLEAYGKKLGLQPSSTLNSHMAVTFFVGYMFARLLEELDRTQPVSDQPGNGPVT